MIVFLKELGFAKPLIKRSCAKGKRLLTGNRLFCEQAFICNIRKGAPVVMKILFMYPPSVYLNHAMFKHYTYFAETINLVKEQGYDVDVLDCGVELFDRRYIYSKLKRSDAVIVLIEPYNIRVAMSLVKITKEMNAKCCTIFYGTAAALIPNYLKKNSRINYIIADGFFYNGLIYALELEKHKSIAELDKTDSKPIIIRGIGKKTTWGNPISDVVPINLYQKYGNNMLEFTVQTGCPYNCSFCSEKILFGNNVKYFEQRPVDNIIEILKEASGRFSSVYFSATTFTYDRQWVLDICNSMIAEGIHIPWRSDTRIDCLDVELVRLMKNAGLKQLSLGIESFESKLLKRVNKGLKSDMLVDQIEMCHSEGITIKALLILGIPGQTADDVRHTNEMVEKLKIPYRWKEYSPIRELYKADQSEENVDTWIDAFDRTEFRTNSIQGLSSREYLELIFPDHYRR